MTIDEAIKHCLEIAEEAEAYKPEVNAPILSETVCKCGEEHRQLAEWLTELKEAKRLLDLVLSDINTDSCCSNCFSCKYLGGCDYSERYEWKHTDEVEKLLNG